MSRPARCLLVSLIATTVVAVPFDPATAAPPATGSEPVATTGLASTPPVSDIVLVDASLGGHNDLEGATIDALDANGKVLQSVVSDDGGAAKLSRAKVRKAVKVRVRGGASEWGVTNNATLFGPIDLHPQMISVVHVTPVTTLAERVARDRGISYRRALRKVYRHLEIPKWTEIRDHANTNSLFSPHRFIDLTERKGGVRQAIRALKRQMDRKAAPRSLGDIAQTPRSVTSFAGQLLFTAVIEAATGQSPDSLIGSIFGVQDPSTAEFTAIAAELQQINEMLTAINQSLADLKVDIKTGEFYTLAAQMADIEDNTQNEWDVYHTVITTNQTDLGDYASDFYNYIAPNIAEYDSLFSTTAQEGVLASLYDLYDVTYPWLNQDDINRMRLIFDYYGTLQAQSVTLLSEAWRFSGTGYPNTKTSQYITTELTTVYQPQSDNIYKAAPTVLTASEVVNVANHRAYTLAPYQQTTAGWYDNRYATYSDRCDTTGLTPTSDVNSKIARVTQTQISSWWASATPAGSTSASTSEMAFLAQTRSVKVTINTIVIDPLTGKSKTTSTTTTATQNALPRVATGAPQAWVAISNQARPSIMASPPGAGTTIDIPIFRGWAFCDSNAVSLTQWASFLKDVVMATGNAYVVPNTTVSASSTVPVGLLVSRSGQWSYPTNL